MISDIIVNITSYIRLCKAYIVIHNFLISCYVANLENRCVLLEPELVVCSSV